MTRNSGKLKTAKEIQIMYSHILLPTDGSERSARAIEAGVQLASAVGAKVTGLFVIDPLYIQEVDEVLESSAQESLSVIAQQAKELGVACNCISVKGAAPQDEIVRIATEKGCDLIVMGTHGRSRVGKLLLGSAAASVLAECEIPVLLYR
jgi:nucleotide-binding universal stress UspA family protein